MRYLFHIAFKGSAYKGWQWQKEEPSVQQNIEDTFKQVYQEECKIHGCGRTDAGVHASQYFFHVDLERKITGKDIFILNKNLPSDITFFDVFPVDDNFNAQLMAHERTYRYYFHFVPNPLISDLSTYSQEIPEEGSIQKAMEMIRGEHDFRAFTLTPDRQSRTSCQVFKSSFHLAADQYMAFFEFTADHFLRGMVRALVSECMNLGIGRRSWEEFERALFEQEKHPHLRLAYPQGLYLHKVGYPGLDIPIKTNNTFTRSI
jgi:tRNA pseudouridine38-40 synthase